MTDKRHEQERAAEMIRCHVTSLNTALGWARTLGLQVRVLARADQLGPYWNTRIIDEMDTIEVKSIIAQEQLCQTTATN